MAYGIVEILQDKTFKELNINFSDLNSGSHQKVYVKCTRCEEIFLRERRKLHQKHHCPSHKERSDGEKLKWCNNCNKYLTLKCFSKNSARDDGFNAYCKACHNQTSSALKSNEKKKDKRNTLSGWIKNYIKAKKSRCKKDGTKFDLLEKDLLDLWYNQSGLCYYFRTKLEFGTNSIRSAWLERLDPASGYTKQNTVWASKAANSMKNDTEYDKFIEFLHDCHTERYSNVRLECKILDEEAKLPFRKRTTDAGHDLYAIEDAIVPPHGTINVGTGLAISVPEGYYYTLEGRSSMWLNGVSPFRGIIDATYTGEVKVALYNVSDTKYEIKKHDRIAQMILHKEYPFDITVVEEFSPEYALRGKAGFGSSGK